MPAEPSIWTAVGFFFIALFSFIFLLFIGWPGVKLTVSIFAAWAQSIPGRIRMLRDPEYRRRVHCAAQYDHRIWLLYCASGAMKQHEGTAGYASAADFFALCRQESAAYFAALTDEELGIIAEHKRVQVYGGKVPLEDLERFLHDERQLIAAAPYSIQKHIEREALRFG